MNKRPKGTQDIYGEKQKYFSFVISTLESMASFYNYKKIDTPVFESIDVFKRSVGETSDIVSKEMYEFQDKKGRYLVLKPEGTAGTVRAVVENKLFAQQLPLKLFYTSSIFRYERPQKGRQRQFNQFGIELFSTKSPAADAEVISFANNILQTFKLTNTKLLINSLGDKKSRDNYSKSLKEFLTKHKKDLSDLSIQRLDKNPLRVLDDKVDSKKSFMKDAPKLSEFLSKESQNYFQAVKDILDGCDIKYEVSEKLVRGLDYYTDIVFEFISESGNAGSQATLIAGGRYDNMVKNFGGPELSATGFGLGIERIVNEVENTDIKLRDSVDAYVINLETKTTTAVSALTNLLRKAGFIIEANLEPIKLNKGFEKAKKENAKFAIIAGPKELQEGKVMVKNQKTSEQDKVDIKELIEYLDGRL